MELNQESLTSLPPIRPTDSFCMEGSARVGGVTRPVPADWTTTEDIASRLALGGGDAGQRGEGNSRVFDDWAKGSRFWQPLDKEMDAPALVEVAALLKAGVADDDDDGGEAGGEDRAAAAVDSVFVDERLECPSSYCAPALRPPKDPAPASPTSSTSTIAVGSLIFPAADGHPAARFTFTVPEPEPEDAEEHRPAAAAPSFRFYAKEDGQPLLIP